MTVHAAMDMDMDMDVDVDVELAIVGGGPAGLAAAIEAARRGVRVTLVDAGDSPGGALALQTHAYQGTGMRGIGLGALLGQTAIAAGASLLPRTLAWGAFEDHTLGLAINHGMGDERSDVLHAAAILIATGAVDRPGVFPGATLPGVITATAATVMLHRWRVRPGAAALVVGNDPITPCIAQYCADGGMVVRVTPASDGLRAMAGPDGTLARVERYDPDGAVTDAWDVDTLVLAEGMQPANELARMVECATVWSAPLGGPVPLRDAAMWASVPGVSIVGDAAGMGDVGGAIFQGRIAAAAIADALGKKKRGFDAFPITLTAGSFRPINADVWRATRLTEMVR